MHEVTLDRRAAWTFLSQRLRQALHGEGHGRRDGARSLAFDERHRAAGTGHKEIHFQALLVAEVVKLSAPARVRLRLDDFRRHKTLEQGAVKGRLDQLGQRIHAEQMAREAGVGQIHLR